MCLHYYLSLSSSGESWVLLFRYILLRSGEDDRGAENRGKVTLQYMSAMEDMWHVCILVLQDDADT